MSALPPPTTPGPPPSPTASAASPTPPPPPEPEPGGAEVPLRVLAAAALLASALVHLNLYFRHGYRDITTANVGRAFLTNAVLAVAVAAALMLRRDAIIRIAGIAVAAGTLGAFVMSRTLDDGFFGFTEDGMKPSPQATIALVAEIIAVVVLALSFVPALRWRQQAVVNPVIGVGLAVAFVVIAVVAGVIWANTDGGGRYGSTSATTTSVGGNAASSTAVTIKGFAFGPKEIDVPVGATVTWTNEDGTEHTVKSADDAFAESDDLGQGATFSHTFDQAGTFAYVCGIHSGMKGTVVVGG